MDSNVCVFERADDNLKDLVELFFLIIIRNHVTKCPCGSFVLEGVDG